MADQEVFVFGISAEMAIQLLETGVAAQLAHKEQPGTERSLEAEKFIIDGLRRGLIEAGIEVAALRFRGADGGPDVPDLMAQYLEVDKSEVMASVAAIRVLEEIGREGAEEE